MIPLQPPRVIRVNSGEEKEKEDLRSPKQLFKRRSSRRLLKSPTQTNSPPRSPGTSPFPRNIAVGQSPPKSKSRTDLFSPQQRRSSTGRTSKKLPPKSRSPKPRSPKPDRLSKSQRRNSTNTYNSSTRSLQLPKKLPLDVGGSPKKSRSEVDLMKSKAFEALNDSQVSLLSEASSSEEPSPETQEATDPLADLSSSHTRKSVSFGNVAVREYARCIGDNPSANPTGPSISIDWDYQEMGEMSHDEYQRKPAPRRSSAPASSTSVGRRVEPLTGMDRAILMGFHTDCTKDDLDKSIRALMVANEERRRSRMRHHLELFEESRRKKDGEKPDDKPVVEMTNLELLTSFKQLMGTMAEDGTAYDLEKEPSCDLRWD